MPDRVVTSRCVCGPSNALALVASLLLPGCNGGLAAIVGSSASDSSSDSNAPGTLAALDVTGEREAPAVLRFVVVDPEGDALSVGLAYSIDGGAVQPLTAIANANPSGYAGNATGTEHEVSWDFRLEPGFDPDGGYVADVTIHATNGAPGVPPTTVEGQNTLSGVGFGNDAPQVEAIAGPATEISGIVPVELTVSDSASDPVSLVLEYDVQGDAPDAGWQLMRPATQSTTPRTSMTDVPADPDGVEVDFFWDTLADLPQGDVTVRARARPSDAYSVGDLAVSEPFLVDNNASPIAALDDLLLFSTEDRFRGIALQVTLTDPEADELLLAIQYRREGQSFPDLPADRAALEAALADPAQRAALRLGTPVMREALGSLVPDGPDTARVPRFWRELSQLAGGLPTLPRLDVLLPAGEVAALDTAFPGAAVTDPAVLALEPGGRALGVLEGAGSGSWRLVRVDLDARTTTELATGTGEPVALDHRLEHWVVGASYSGGFDVTTLDGDGALVASYGTTGALRDLAAENPRLVYATVDDAVVRLGLTDTGLERLTLFDGLAEPWGLVLDRWHHARAFVAERGADRVLQLDLTRLVADPLPAEDAEGGIAFPSPRALALAPDGTRLVAVCQGGSGVELRERRIGRALRRDDGSSGPLVHALLTEAAAAASPLARVALGADGALVADPASGAVLVTGLVQQSRSITAVDPVTGRLTVDVPFSPALDGPRRFRARWSSVELSGSPVGRPWSFGWDAGADLDSPGPTYVRVTPYDLDRGVGSASSLPIDVEDPRGLTALLLGADGPATVADLDGDGDLDLATGASGASHVLRQGPAGSFSADPGPIAFTAAGPGLGSHSDFGNFGLFVHAPDPGHDVVAADLDRDGRLDLLAAGAAGLEVAFQAPDGSFPAAPAVFPYPAGSLNPLEARVAELGGAPGLEVIVPLHGSAAEDTTEVAGGVLVFEQTAPQVWDLAHVHDLPEGQHAMLVEPVDHDGDGDLDLLLAVGGGPLFGDASLVVLENLPGGVFAAGSQLLHDYETAAVTVDALASLDPVDLDEDGRVDLLAGHGPNQSGLYIFGIQPPDLTWGLALNRAEAGGGYAWITEQVSPVLIDPYTNEPATLVFGSALSELTVLDADGDGRYDLFTEDWARTLHLRDGVSAFSGVPQHLGGASPVGRLESWIGDLDGDGDLDHVGAAVEAVLGATPSSTEWTATARGVLDPPGPAAPAEIFFPGELQDPPGPESLVGANIAEVEAVDVDGDGDLDLLLAMGHGNELPGPKSTSYPIGGVHVLLQTAPRRFVASQYLPSRDGDGTCFDVELGDLTGDGLPDLVLCANPTSFFGSAQIQVHAQTSPGVFDPVPVVLAFPSFIGGVFDIELSDLDGDGDLDVAATRYRGLAVLLQQPGAVFEEIPIAAGFAFPSIPDSFGQHGAIGVAVADVDGDGRLDLVSGPADVNSDTDPDQGPIRIAYQTSRGTFDLVRPTGLPSEPSRSVDARDVDGDGRVDLLWTLADGTLYVARQRPDGGFDARLVDEVAAPSSEVRDACRDAYDWRDLDGDGRLDLTLSVSGGIRTYLQTAPGRLELRRVLDLDDGTKSTGVACDLDGDGELDLVAPEGDNWPFSAGEDPSQVFIRWGGSR